MDNINIETEEMPVGRTVETIAEKPADKALRRSANRT
jgi:hypothetical protein